MPMNSWAVNPNHYQNKNYKWYNSTSKKKENFFGFKFKNKLLTKSRSHHLRASFKIVSKFLMSPTSGFESIPGKCSHIFSPSCKPFIYFQLLFSNRLFSEIEVLSWMHFNSEYVSQSFRQKEFIFSDTLVPGIDRFSVIVSDITVYFVNRHVASHQGLMIKLGVYG